MLLLWWSRLSPPSPLLLSCPHPRPRPPTHSDMMRTTVLQAWSGTLLHPGSEPQQVKGGACCLLVDEGGQGEEPSVIRCVCSQSVCRAENQWVGLAPSSGESSDGNGQGQASVGAHVLHPHPLPFCLSLASVCTVVILLLVLSVLSLSFHSSFHPSLICSRSTLLPEAAGIIYCLMATAAAARLSLFIDHRVCVCVCV